MSLVLTFIQRDLDSRMKKNPKYSLRAYARDLNIEPSALSKIIRGKRAISDSMRRHLSLRLGIAQDASTPYDLQSVQSGLYASSQVSSVSELKNEIRQLAGELIKVLEHEKRPHILRIAFYPLPGIQGSESDPKN